MARQVTFSSSDLILTINPRLPFTKIAVYNGNVPVFLKKIKHTKDDLVTFKAISDQSQYRSNAVFDELKHNDIELDLIKIIISRGGLTKPVHSGVYKVNNAMIKDLREGYSGEDVVNLGGLMSNELAVKLPNAMALVADPVVVDEFHELARVSGHADFQRKSIFHALNQKAVAQKYAKLHGKEYESLNLIVVHLSSGITIGAHQKGKVIDATQGLDGDGPFSPFRSGTLPVGDLIKMCYSGKYTLPEMLQRVRCKGGLYSHLGTFDVLEIEERIINDDEKARLIYSAMAYQVSKHIASMSAVLSGEVDAILMTGPIAQSRMFTDQVTERVKHLANVHVFPGGDELSALAASALHVMKGDLELSDYK